MSTQRPSETGIHLPIQRHGTLPATKAILLMARAPDVTAKTRLGPVCTPEDRVTLVSHMLEDTLETVVRVAQALPGLRLYVACQPSPDHPGLQALWKKLEPTLAPLQPRWLAQAGADLGERMQAVLDVARADGIDEVCYLGSDSPTLPSELILEAFQALKRTSRVFGPSFDGGYYLLAAKDLQRVRPGVAPERFPLEVLQEIPWSTDQVLVRSLEQAWDASQTSFLLPFWYDVDLPEDLAALPGRLRSLRLQGDVWTGRHTEAWLQHRPRRS